MAFTEIEIAEHADTIEELLWSRHRPPLPIRDQMREGQRFTDQAIEFFYVRPSFGRPGTFIEDAIAKVQFVRSRDVWRLYWQRADGKWHGYPLCPEVESLAAALRVINEDASNCFFG